MVRVRSHALAVAGLAVVMTVGLACRSSRPKLVRGDASVIVAQARTPPGGAPVIVENEGGAAPDTITAVAFSVNGEFVAQGSLAGADTDDRFAIDIPGGQAPVVNADAGTPRLPVSPTRQLALLLTPDVALAAALVATDGAGTAVARTAGAAGVAQALPNLAVSPGQRLVLNVRRTSKAPPTGSAAYTLTGRLSDLGAADEREPNDTAAVATATGPAHTAPEVAGLLGGTNDVDWFSVPIGEAGEGTVVVVTLDPPAEAAANLTVHDAGGTRLASARGAKGQRLTLRQLSPLALGAGAAPGLPAHFFVEVRTEGAGDREHRYLLQVRSEEAPPGEREPNDDVAHASTLADGSALGYFGSADVDHYRFEGHAGQPVALTVTPPQHVDVVIETQVTGQARWTRTDAQRRGQPESTTLTPDSEGPVLLRLVSKRQVEPSEEPYRILLERR